MPKIIINGQEQEISEGLTVIQACDNAGIQIPRFCYHDKLPSVASCRMCLVEISGSNKLVPSCSTPVYEGMEVKTESVQISEARKSVLEMLLVNHPLDCPICDKGGECDLQDQTYRYGLDKSVINVPKRAIEQKDFGPLIDPYMTRCILCTRCIRFATEIAGVEGLGALGRGDHTEINTYVSKSLESELSGNIADVCPVGALTHSNYAFKSRPWELISTETIDIMDSVGSNIKVDASPLAVLRIMPKTNEEINETWLADKSRYIVDALRVQRLDVPLIRVDGQLKKSTWDEVFTDLASKIKLLNPSEIASLAGDFVDCETMFAMKNLLNNIGSDNMDCRFGAYFDRKDRSSYLFNTTIAGVEESDACLIIGSNPRVEAPLVNSRLRKKYLSGNLKIALIGEKYNLNYNYDYLGDNISILQEIIDGQHPFAKVLKTAKNPMIILGMGAFEGLDTNQVTSLAKQVAIKYNMIQENWNGYNVLNTSVSVLNGLEIGFVSNDEKINTETILASCKIKNIKLLWLINVDNIDFDSLGNEVFVVYQGHHGDKGASRADIILPSSLWLEQDATFVNLEGRIQRAYKSVSTVGEAKEGWKIIRKFSEYLENPLPYNNIDQLRIAMSEQNNNFYSLGLVKAEFKKENINISQKTDRKVKSSISDYYLTDIISRNSLKMIECSKLFVKKN